MINQQSNQNPQTFSFGKLDYELLTLPQQVVFPAHQAYLMESVAVMTWTIINILTFTYFNWFLKAQNTTVTDYKFCCFNFSSEYFATKNHTQFLYLRLKLNFFVFHLKVRLMS